LEVLPSWDETSNDLNFYRWQTNGAYAVGDDGKIRYAHIGKNSGDMADLDAAIKSVI
jgi:hypothetical protein